MCIRDSIYVVLANRVAKHHHHLIVVNNLFCHLDGMPYSLPVDLLYITGLQFRIFSLYIVPYFVAEVSYYKNKLLDSCFTHLINNDTEYRLSCKRDKSLWLCIAVRTQLSASACYWDDCLH